MQQRQITTLTQPLTHVEGPAVTWDVATLVFCQNQEACARAYAAHSTRLQEAAVARIREALQICQEERRGVTSGLRSEVMAETFKVT